MSEYQYYEFQAVDRPLTEQEMRELRYDEAVKLLCELRDLALRDGRVPEVEARLLRLCEEHAKKPSLIERLRRAGLTKPGG